MTVDTNSSSLLQEHKDKLAALPYKHRIPKETFEAAGEILLSALQKVLDEFKEVHAITWTMYTPGFNDGDICVFGIHDIGFIPTKEVINDIDAFNELLSEYKITEDDYFNGTHHHPYVYYEECGEGLKIFK